MDVDIRIPIGLLFVVLGLLLTIFGLATINDTELYVGRWEEMSTYGQDC